MRLTLFSDYSLRLLLYLAAHQDRTVALAEVAGAYGVSQNHLVKVVQKLVARGFVESARGRGGGLRLACPPEAINIGALVRMTEPDMDLVECFERRTNTCPIEPACGLKMCCRAHSWPFWARWTPIRWLTSSRGRRRSSSCGGAVRPGPSAERRTTRAHRRGHAGRPEFRI